MNVLVHGHQYMPSPRHRQRERRTELFSGVLRYERRGREDSNPQPSDP